MLTEHIYMIGNKSIYFGKTNINDWSSFIQTFSLLASSNINNKHDSIGRLNKMKNQIVLWIKYQAYNKIQWSTTHQHHHNPKLNSLTKDPRMINDEEIGNRELQTLHF